MKNIILQTVLLVSVTVLLVTPVVTLHFSTPATTQNVLTFYESMPIRSTRDFEFIFKYGVGARNELNAFFSLYTKDMVIDPPVTTGLSLTDEEMEMIRRKMIEIDLFSYPDQFSVTVPPDGVVGIRTPYSSYYFLVKHGLSFKLLYWADQIVNKNDKADALRELINLIMTTIKSKDQYKKLPDARGAYL